MLLSMLFFLTVRARRAIKSHLCCLFKEKQTSTVRAKHNHLSFILPFLLLFFYTFLNLKKKKRISFFHIYLLTC